ncbi:MAG TPA: glycosyltransferase family 4 protein [Candidatus Saccharimonadales bacterium]|nr:glycosyltransferase family 4 protein [Candidatus Saccharimonadales bacterium]
MKILHVTKKYPGAMGGDAVVVSQLCAEQQAAGHEIAVITSNCDEISAEPHIYKCGLKNTPANLDRITLRRLVSLVCLFFVSFGIIRRERPDIIHSHSVDMAFCVAAAARFRGVPLMHTFHIVTHYDPEQSFLRRKTELWMAKLTGARIVTAPNPYDVGRLQAAGLRQTVLLPNGVDLTFWQPGNPDEQGGPCTFVAVGRLERQKGFNYLIEAAALAASAAAQPFRVIIVGEGSQQPMLQARAKRLGVEKIVQFSGAKNRQQVRQLLSVADVVVIPSLYETTPLTLLEAWAMGLPVIATPVGILRGVPAPAAHVVPPKDEQALAEAMILYIQNNTARARLAALGQKEVQRYAWPRIAQTAKILYRSAL